MPSIAGRGRSPQKSHPARVAAVASPSGWEGGGEAAFPGRIPAGSAQLGPFRQRGLRELPPGPGGEETLPIGSGTVSYFFKQSQLFLLARGGSCKRSSRIAGSAEPSGDKATGERAGGGRAGFQWGFKCPAGAVRQLGVSLPSPPRSADSGAAAAGAAAAVARCPPARPRRG